MISAFPLLSIMMWSWDDTGMSDLRVGGDRGRTGGGWGGNTGPWGGDQGRAWDGVWLHGMGR